MNSNPNHPPILRAFLVALMVLSCCVSAHGQAMLSFAGGSGSPLSLTLNTPVTYTITQPDDTERIPTFNFQDVGNPFSGTLFAVTGTITFTVNGGTANSLTMVGSGPTEGDITPDTIYAVSFDSEPGAMTGDVIVLSAGTLTTTSNVMAAAPAAGSFTTFITGSAGIQTSTDGVAVIPEPSSWLMILGCMGLVGGMRSWRQIRSR